MIKQLQSRIGHRDMFKTHKKMTRPMFGQKTISHRPTGLYKLTQPHSPGLEVSDLKIQHNNNEYFLINVLFSFSFQKAFLNRRTVICRLWGIRHQTSTKEVSTNCVRTLNFRHPKNARELVAKESHPEYVIIISPQNYTTYWERKHLTLLYYFVVSGVVPVPIHL